MKDIYNAAKALEKSLDVIRDESNPFQFESNKYSQFNSMIASFDDFINRLDKLKEFQND